VNVSTAALIRPRGSANPAGALASLQQRFWQGLRGRVGNRTGGFWQNQTQRPHGLPR